MRTDQHGISDRFEPLLSWWDRDTSMEFGTVVNEVERILVGHGIRLRQHDGDLVQVNFSLPRSPEVGLVLGLRYRKRDETLTEDHFLCSQQPSGLKIVTHYRGSLERVLSEYRGTHKEQPDLTSAVKQPWPDGVVTDVRTISFTKPIK